MNRIALYLLLAFGFVAGPGIAAEPDGNTPEWRLVIELRADAARCSIDGRMLHIRMQEQGASADVEAAFGKARACADSALSSGRDFYRTALKAAPASKPVLAKAYATWMSYMETLAVPMETDEQATAGAAFEAAVSEIRAELDAR